MSKTRINVESYSSLSTYLKCQRKYYYYYVKRIYKKAFYLPFFQGKFIHYGISLCLSRTPIKLVLRKTIEYMKEELVQYKNYLTKEDKEKLSVQPYMLAGCVAAYSDYFGRWISTISKVKSEVEFRTHITDNTMLVGKIDNVLLLNNNNILVHELKAYRDLSNYRVGSVLSGLQTAVYVYLSKIKTIKDVVVNVIKKPQLKFKKSETLVEFGERLENWYTDNGGENVFFTDIIGADDLDISRADCVNTVVNISKQIEHNKKHGDIDGFLQNFESCFDHGSICEFYDLCHWKKSLEEKEVFMCGEYNVRERGIR